MDNLLNKQGYPQKQKARMGPFSRFVRNVVTLVDGFRPRAEKRSLSAGMCVHVQPEYTFTFNQNRCSRCAGIRRRLQLLAIHAPTPNRSELKRPPFNCDTNEQHHNANHKPYANERCDKSQPFSKGNVGSRQHGHQDSGSWANGIDDTLT